MRFECIYHAMNAWRLRHEKEYYYNKNIKMIIPRNFINIFDPFHYRFDSRLTLSSLFYYRTYHQRVIRTPSPSVGAC